MVFILVCVAVQNTSTRVNLDHVLKLGVNDEVNCVGKCLSKMKLGTKVSLFFYAQNVHPSNGLGTSRNWTLCSQNHNRLYLFDCLHPGRAFLLQKKRALKTSYNIFTTSLTKFEKQRFSRYLLLANVKSPWVRLWCLTYTGWSHMSHYKLLYPPVQIPDTLECDPRNDCVV